MCTGPTEIRFLVLETLRLRNPILGTSGQNVPHPWPECARVKLRRTAECRHRASARANSGVSSNRAQAFRVQRTGVRSAAALTFEACALTSRQRLTFKERKRKIAREGKERKKCPQDAYIYNTYTRNIYIYMYIYIYIYRYEVVYI